MAEAGEANKVAWKPQDRADGTPGPQTLLLTCPANEILFGGARGGGKSDGINGDWIAHAGRHGKKAHGVIFRQTYKQLTDLLRRQHDIFPLLGAKFNKAEYKWTFPGGATLELRYASRLADAREYQGFQFSWMAVEEIGEWADPDPLDLLKATLRSPEGVPVRLIVTANPGGAGHKWIKARYIDPMPPLTPILDETTGFTKVFIPAALEDNPALLKNDPDYERRLMASGPAWLVQAWRYGDWDITPDKDDALWTRKIIQDSRVGKAPDLVRIVVAIDPAVTARTTSDETGIVVAGADGKGEYYVLEDASGKMTNDRWANRAIDLYRKYNADRIIGETNNGGDLIENIIRQKERDISFKAVHASRGKIARAEPIAALYEQGKVHHVGVLTELENQMCRLGSDGKADGKSPDRVDALVWALSFLSGKRPVQFMTI